MIKSETTIFGLMVTTVLVTGVTIGVNAVVYQVGKLIGRHEERKRNSIVKYNHNNFRKENEES